MKTRLLALLFAMVLAAVFAHAADKKSGASLRNSAAGTAQGMTVAAPTPSGAVGPPPEKPPETPSFFHADGPAEASSTTMWLTWKDNSNNEEKFLLWRLKWTPAHQDFKSKEWNDQIAIPANTTKYRDTGLEPETRYKYFLIAKSYISGYNSWYVEADGWTNPHPPENLQVQALAGRKAKLTWKNMSDMANLLVIQRSAGSPSSFQTIHQKGPITFSAYVDEGLTPGTAYYYRLLAVKQPFQASDYTTVVGPVVAKQ